MTKTTIKDIEDRLLVIEPKISMVEEHDKILVRGNGSPSLQEEVRTLKNYVGEQKAWFKAIALLFAGQFVAVSVGMVILFIQVLPILQGLTKTAYIP